MDGWRAASYCRQNFRANDKLEPLVESGWFQCSTFDESPNHFRVAAAQPSMMLRTEGSTIFEIWGESPMWLSAPLA